MSETAAQEVDRPDSYLEIHSDDGHVFDFRDNSFRAASDVAQTWIEVELNGLPSRPLWPTHFDSSAARNGSIRVMWMGRVFASGPFRHAFFTHDTGDLCLSISAPAIDAGDELTLVFENDRKEWFDLDSGDFRPADSAANPFFPIEVNEFESWPDSMLLFAVAPRGLIAGPLWNANALVLRSDDLTRLATSSLKHALVIENDDLPPLLRFSMSSYGRREAPKCAYATFWTADGDAFDFATGRFCPLGQAGEAALPSPVEATPHRWTVAVAPVEALRDALALARFVFVHSQLGEGPDILRDPKVAAAEIEGLVTREIQGSMFDGRLSFPSCPPGKRYLMVREVAGLPGATRNDETRAVDFHDLRVKPISAITSLAAPDERLDFTMSDVGDCGILEAVLCLQAGAVPCPLDREIWKRRIQLSRRSDLLLVEGSGIGFAEIDGDTTSLCDDPAQVRQVLFDAMGAARMFATYVYDLGEKWRPDATVEQLGYGPMGSVLESWSNSLGWLYHVGWLTGQADSVGEGRPWLPSAYSVDSELDDGLILSMDRLAERLAACPLEEVFGEDFEQELDDGRKGSLRTCLRAKEVGFPSTVMHSLNRAALAAHQFVNVSRWHDKRDQNRERGDGTRAHSGIVARKASRVTVNDAERRLREIDSRTPLDRLRTSVRQLAQISGASEGTIGKTQFWRECREAKAAKPKGNRRPGCIELRPEIEVNLADSRQPEPFDLITRGESSMRNQELERLIAEQSRDSEPSPLSQHGRPPRVHRQL